MQINGLLTEYCIFFSREIRGQFTYVIQSALKQRARYTPQSSAYDPDAKFSDVWSTFNIAAGI